jgi:Ca2+-binding RTX toxin-like protein
VLDNPSGEDGEDDHIAAQSDVLTLVGGNDDDLFEAQQEPDGDQRFVGGGGTDTVSYALRDEPVTLNVAIGGGSAGEHDTWSGITRFIGGSANDTFVDPARSDGTAMVGGDGADTVSYAARTNGVVFRTDTATNGEAGENDEISAVEHATGGAGNDVLTGTSTSNRLRGGAGNDRITGGAGDDDLRGDGGDDEFLEGPTASGADVLLGGAGIDVANYSSRAAKLTIDLDNVADDGAASEHDNVRSDVESITGGANADRLTGSTAANTISGRGGNDVIDGRGGTDTILCGAGADKALRRSGAKYSQCESLATSLSSAGARIARIVLPIWLRLRP